MEKTKKIAVYIDAQNISFRYASNIIENLSQKGVIIIKELVADWRETAQIHLSQEQNQTANQEDLKLREDNMRGWRKAAADFSMTPVQQFAYSGKNSNDFAIVINAMKDLYEKPFIDLFCLVSTDRDFTRLAQEIKKHDKEVIGMGKTNANIEFINAFSEYVYLDKADEKAESAIVIETATDKTEKPGSTVLSSKAKKTQTPAASGKIEEKTEVKEISKPCILDEKRLDRLNAIIEELIEDSGKAIYARIGGEMKKYYADFTPINYGYKNFRSLMKDLLPYLPKYSADGEKDDMVLNRKKTPKK